MGKGVLMQESCVAWFKLAELIERKEKEKALNLYRLLSHSFHDRAYALQLEGDILWALEDNDAVEKYKQAAFLYKKEQKLINSIAVYNHLLVFNPGNFDILSTILLLYSLVDWPEKFEFTLKEIISFRENKKISEQEFLTLIKKILDENQGKSWVQEVLTPKSQTGL